MALTLRTKVLMVIREPATKSEELPMRLMVKVTLIATMAGASLLSGCASVPMASTAEDAAAKQFSVDPDRSKIYLYRNETFGGPIKIPVTLNGRMMGQTAPNTYFVWDVAPGKQEITCIGEENASLSIDAKPRTAYYVWQEMKMGMWSAGCALHEVPEAEGRKAVKECKLAQGGH
jgi:hypothetical protein